MFVYIFAICLLGFNSGSGAPTNLNATISKSISDLANTCENPFLSSQLKSKAQDCEPTVPPNSEKQFQCMLFLDINRQLCSAVGASRLALIKDYSTKINETQDITQLCKTARDWTFSDLGNVYKKYVELVFSDVVKCVRVCSADNTDILNVDSNFYCKYFKWGFEMLKKQVSVAPPSGIVALPDQNPMAISGAAIISPGAGAVSGDVPVNSVPSKSTDALMVPAPILPDGTNDVQTKKEVTTSTKDQIPAGNGNSNLPQTGAAEVNTSDKVDPTNNKATIESNVKPSSNPESNSVVSEKEKMNNEPVKENSQPSAEQQQEVNPVGAAPDLAGLEEKNPDPNVETKKDKIPDSEKNEIPPIDPKNSPNDNIDGDDYASDIDSEDSRGPDTQQGDDDADPGLADVDTKPESDPSKNNKRGEMLSAADMSQKEYYRGDDFPEEEDHFFSFFLTAIIMVVLLYILYHNKSKVSKVIMGLIVEGRQPGRRRNSRGHAYKRLDTLEQAMSTNTAAPPSKIIY